MWISSLEPWVSSAGPSVRFSSRTAAATSPPSAWLFCQVSVSGEWVATYFVTLLNARAIPAFSSSKSPAAGSCCTYGQWAAKMS